MIRGFWRDLIPLGLLFLFPLLLFAAVSLGPKTLVPADALYTFEPYASAAESMGVEDVHNPLLADLVLQNYAWKQFLVEAARTRSLPLWDPYIFAGHPFLANGQHSALYPLSLIFLVLPIPRAFGVFVVLQLAMAGWWMYVLGRTFKAGRLGGFVAGLTFQLSGFMIVSVVHPMIIAAASWLPLLLALIEAMVTRRRFWLRERAMLPWTLLGAMVLGVQILAGHPETTYFSLLVMAGFATWRLLQRSVTLPRAAWRAEVISPALGLVLMVTLGLALGAVQLLPFYEVAQSSFRQDAATLQEVLGWAYPERRIITFFMPDFFGNPTHRTLHDLFTGVTVRANQNAYGEPIAAFDWGIKNYVEGGAYLGILPLLLALVALLRPTSLMSGTEHAATEGPPRRGRLSRWCACLARWLRQPYVPFLTALSLFSLASIFGTPVYALVYMLPFLSQSHSPFRWVFPLTVAVSALAGLGAATIVRMRRQSPPPALAAVRKRRPWLVRVLLLDTRVNWVTVLAALAIWGGLGVVIATWVSRLAFGRLESSVEHVFWSMAQAAHAFPDHRAFYSYLYPQFLTFGGFLIASGIVLRISQCSIRLPRRLGRRPIWEVLAVIVVLTDLVSFGAGFNPAVDPALLNYYPPVVEFLKQDMSLWRMSVFAPQGRKTFDANTPMFYDVHDVRGYDSIFSAQYVRYMSWIEPQGALLYNRIAPFTQVSSLDSPLTDLLNVKYIVTEEEIPLPKYRQVYEDAAVRVYENLGVTPRAFSLPLTSTLRVADGAAVGEAILSYDPRFYAIIESADEGWSGPTPPAVAVAPDPVPGAPTSQSVASYGANEVLVDVEVATPSWLILADAFAPGWKAFTRPLGGGESEETEVPIARVAGNFRGVRLGESATVRFKYTPNSVKVGVFVSFLSGMMMIFMAVVWTWRLFYRGDEAQSTVHRLAKNSVAPIVLTLFNKAIDFGFMALMLRILGPADVGRYYYAGVILLWFDIVINFGLQTYVTREVARHRDEARRYLRNTVLIRMALILAGILLLLGFIGVRQWGIGRLTDPAAAQTIWALVILYVGIIPGSISNALTALFYANEKAEYPAAITTVSTLLRVTLQTLVLILGLGIVSLAGAAIVVNLATLALLGMFAWRTMPALREGAADKHESEAHKLRWRSSPERKLRRDMLRESWPLMLNNLLAILFFKVDVFLMEFILGDEAVGVYNIGYKLLESMMIIPSMFTLALFPVISRQAEGDREALTRFYRLGTKILVVLVLPAALITTVASREMVLVLGGADYLPGAATVLRLVAWSMPFGWINSITQYVLIALGEQRYLTRAYAAGFAFTFISNLILMPFFGYRASAVLHIFSELLLLIPFLLGVRRHLGLVGWWQVLGKPILMAAISGACAVALLALGRLPAVLALLIVYPLLMWRLGVLTEDEQRMLAPLLRRQVAP